MHWLHVTTLKVPLRNESHTESDAAKAVQSIPAYVEVADLFIALVPDTWFPDSAAASSLLMLVGDCFSAKGDDFFGAGQTNVLRRCLMSRP